MRQLEDITDSMDMSLSKLRKIVMEEEAWHAMVHRVSKRQTQLRSKHFHFPDTNTGTIQVLGEVVCDEGLVSGAPQGAPQELAGGRTHRGSDGRGRDV